MQRGDRPIADRLEQREMELVDMEVHNVEMLGGIPDPVSISK